MRLARLVPAQRMVRRAGMEWRGSRATALRDSWRVPRFRNLWLVAIAGQRHPFPSRTRPLRARAAMILRPGARESSAPPTSLQAPRGIAGGLFSLVRKAVGVRTRGLRPAQSHLKFAGENAGVKMRGLRPAQSHLKFAENPSHSRAKPHEKVFPR